MRHNPPPPRKRTRLRELIRTNDPVLISFVEALLRGEGIATLLLDPTMSVLDGAIGILPRRLMVETADYARAVDFLREAGLGAELRNIGNSGDR